MSQPRLYLDRPINPGDSIAIDGDRARYIKRVLRKPIGATLCVFADGDCDYQATIVAIDNRSVELRIGEGRQTNAESTLAVCLYQGLARGERMDFVVQKATELGVSRIAPVFTEFSMVKLNAERAERRRQHWEKVAQSACEQCGRSRVPEIVEPRPLIDVLQAEAWSATRLMLAPTSAEKLADLDEVGERVEVLIGPEGGLSPAETDAALAAQFRGISLGPRILRTETAALSALTALQVLWGDV